MSKYPWQSIDPKDYVYLEANQLLTMQDVRVLTKLYKPIIGGGAYSLFQSLFSELDFQASQKGTTISRLLTKLDMGIREFYEARIRLEGIGLLRVYRAGTSGPLEAREYIYELAPPLSTKDFLKDSLLRTLLIEKIGERLFEEELEQLTSSTYPKDNFQEMTRSFLDVYHFDIQQKDVLKHTDFMPFESNERPKIAETIENTDSFDFDFFKASLKSHFIRQDSLTSEIKELIYTFHIVYGIDELTMQSLILESADIETGEINPRKFTSNVQRVYLNKQKTENVEHQKILQDEKQAAGISPKEQEVNGGADDKLSQRGFTAAEISVIKHAKLDAPGNYLKSIKKQKEGFVTRTETWVLKELVEQSSLRKEVINILLHYVLVVKNQVVLEQNYVMKIANDWSQSGVKTAEDAIEKIKKLYNQPQGQAQGGQKQSANRGYQNKYRPTRKKETLPDWATQDTSQTGDDELVSDQDENNLLSRLEQIRKRREAKEDN